MTTVFRVGVEYDLTPEQVEEMRRYLEVASDRKAREMLERARLWQAKREVVNSVTTRPGLESGD